MFSNRPDAGYEAEVLKALRSLTDEIEMMGRKLTSLQVSVAAMRKKLGFEDSWAEMKHDQEYIDVLKDELRAKKRSML